MTFTEKKHRFIPEPSGTSAGKEYSQYAIEIIHEGSLPRPHCALRIFRTAFCGVVTLELNIHSIE